MQLFCGDSLQVLKSIENNSIDLIVTDPPYYKVVSNDWDNQWKSEEHFLNWCDSVLKEFQRILKSNGSLYWFAGPYMAAKIELLIEKRFNVLNHLVWVKPSGRHLAANKESLTKFFPQSERIIFAERNSSNKSFDKQCIQLQRQLYAPIVNYFNDLRKASGLTIKQCVDICGKSTASHYFQLSQFHFPSKKHFDLLMNAFSVNNDKNGNEVREQFELIRSEYHQLKEQFKNSRRSFSVTANVPFTDVWTFDVVQYYKGKHPCEKPLDLIRHIIETSSRPGFKVLDAFMGSGSIGKACLDLSREFIGVELDSDNFNQASENLIRHWSNRSSDLVA